MADGKQYLNEVIKEISRMKNKGTQKKKILYKLTE
jgi:hypothetical protein